MAKERQSLDDLKNKLEPRVLRREMVKSARINLRVTEADKASMTAMAKACGMTVTTYLTQLNRIAAEVLNSDDATT